MFWGATWIDCGDLDGDGDLDLVGTSELTDGIWEQESDLTWFENLDGEGESWLQHDLDLHFDNASEAHVADIDGDGDLDIVGAHSYPFGPSNFHWWENTAGNGSSWTKRVIPFQFSGSGRLDVGDIDGDGDIDLFGAGHLGGALGWWENLDGSGLSWQAWQVGPLVRGRVIKLGDLDGDGDLDGLAASDQLPQWGGLWWYENLTTFRPTGELTSSVLDAVDPEWEAIHWDATVGASSDLLVEVRASNDPDDLGPFIQVSKSGDALGPLIGPDSRFLQYRVTLEGSDPTESPVLREIRVETGPLLAIFSDGFESGDTSAWTPSVP